MARYNTAQIPNILDRKRCHTTAIFEGQNAFKKMTMVAIEIKALEATKPRDKSNKHNKPMMDCQYACLFG